MNKVEKQLLKIENLSTYFFTSSGTVKAVDGVSFSINKGETLGIVGESGSGKSITAMSIMRLVPDPPGRIVDGKIIFKENDLLLLSEQEMRRIRGNEISMIFQDPMTALNPLFTIGEQIAEVIRLHQKTDKNEAWERAIKMLDLVGIPEPEKRVGNYPHEFSGGMRQRAMIAMSLSCNPVLLIADEPTTALDVTVQAQILELMKELQQELGMAIMMITHDLGVVAETCDHVLVMYAGKGVECADVNRLFTQPKHPYTWGLLASQPSLDKEEREKLTPIKGGPPDLRFLPPGCSFAPRCKYTKPICFEQKPELLPVDGNHCIACHLTEQERQGILGVR